MARWENEDVSDLNLPDPQKVDKEYFGKSAASVDKKEAFAYMATVDKSNSYYILADILAYILYYSNSHYILAYILAHILTMYEQVEHSDSTMYFYPTVT